MNTDEKNKSAEQPDRQSAQMPRETEEEIIELVEEVENSEQTKPPGSTKGESPDVSESARGDETIELTEVVEEKVSTEGESVSADQSASFDSEAPIELTEPVDALEAESDEQAMAEFAQFARDDETDDKAFIEDVGLEMNEEPSLEDAEVSEATSVPGTEEAMPRDTAEVSQLSEELLETGEQADQPVPSEEFKTETDINKSLAEQEKILKSVILERLSNETIESTIRQVVKETIEEKAERILLEMAETAVNKEIEKIKKSD